MKIRCGIKIIFIATLTLPASQWALGWETGISGNYSTAWQVMPATPAYNSYNAKAEFFDFGGRLARRWGPGYLGIHFGLYSSFGLREEIPLENQYVTPFVSAKSAEIGSLVTYSGGSYRAALGWSAVQVRYRFYFYDIFYADAGFGAAYGFGAIDSTLKGNSAIGLQTGNQYHRYSEWGFISAAATGIVLPLDENLVLETTFEIAWLVADIRHPNINLPLDYQLSQVFYRPGIGVMLRF